MITFEIYMFIYQQTIMIYIVDMYMYVRRVICFPEPLNLLLTIFLPLSLSQCYYKFTCVLSLLYF